MQQSKTRHTILFVEDESADIELARLAAMACRPKCDIHVVVNADAAFDYLTIDSPEQLPLIVLLDLKLPKLDGLAVLRRLRMHPVTRDVPVLVFSTEFTHADVLMSYQVGANSFVARPLDALQFTDFFSHQLDYWQTSKRQHSART